MLKKLSRMTLSPFMLLYIQPYRKLMEESLSVAATLHHCLLSRRTVTATVEPVLIQDDCKTAKAEVAGTTSANGDDPGDLDRLAASLDHLRGRFCHDAGSDTARRSSETDQDPAAVGKPAPCLPTASREHTRAWRLAGTTGPASQRQKPHL